jgi:hypothetical protein
MFCTCAPPSSPRLCLNCASIVCLNCFQNGKMAQGERRSTCHTKLSNCAFRAKVNVFKKQAKKMSSLDSTIIKTANDSFVIEFQVAKDYGSDYWKKLWQDKKINRIFPRCGGVVSGAFARSTISFPSKWPYPPTQIVTHLFEVCVRVGGWVVYLSKNVTQVLQPSSHCTVRSER